MSKMVEPPSQAELEKALGSAFPLWADILHIVEEAQSPIDKVWRPSKTEFGRMCLLQHKKRTLLYLTPDTGSVWMAIVLGERAYQLAMASSLPDPIKDLFREAKPYAEGRGIRFSLRSKREISTVVQLLGLKTARL